MSAFQHGSSGCSFSPECLNAERTLACEMPAEAECGALGEAQTTQIDLDRTEELLLVHHYTTSTYKTISRDEKDTYIWRDAVFEDGLEFAFVLDAVLALTALHKAFLNPREGQKHISNSLAYQDQGLRAYQAQLTDYNPRNCKALFIFPVIMNISIIAMSRGYASMSATSPIRTLHSVLEILRGVKVIFHTSSDIIRTSVYQGLLSARGSQYTTCSPASVAGAMERLRKSMSNTTPQIGSDMLALYKVAIDTLEAHFQRYEHEGDVGAIISWPLGLGELGTELFRQGNRGMMLIFTHYGVLFLQVSGQWWARDFGARLIHELSESLRGMPAAWEASLAWANSEALKSEVALDCA